MGLPASTKAYASNALNQYTTVSGVALSYDACGNLTSDGTWTYGYDTENRLVSASKAGLSVAYIYDATGRQIWRNVTTGGVTTAYAWLMVGDQEWAEYVGVGTANLSRVFAYGAGLDEPVVGITASNNARNYYFQDALGSVIALTNAAGQLTEKHAYTAYGLDNRQKVPIQRDFAPIFTLICQHETVSQRFDTWRNVRISECSDRQ